METTLFLTSALEGAEGSASRPGHTLSPGKTRYPLYRRLDGPQGRSGQVRKISPPTGIRSPDRPARRKSALLIIYNFKECHVDHITLNRSFFAVSYQVQTVPQLHFRAAILWQYLISACMPYQWRTQEFFSGGFKPTRSNKSIPDAMDLTDMQLLPDREAEILSHISKSLYCDVESKWKNYHIITSPG